MKTCNTKVNNIYRVLIALLCTLFVCFCVVNSPVAIADNENADQNQPTNRIINQQDYNHGNHEGNICVFGNNVSLYTKDIKRMGQKSNLESAVLMKGNFIATLGANYQGRLHELLGPITKIQVSQEDFETICSIASNWLPEWGGTFTKSVNVMILQDQFMHQEETINLMPRAMTIDITIIKSQDLTTNPTTESTTEPTTDPTNDSATDPVEPTTDPSNHSTIEPTEGQDSQSASQKNDSTPKADAQQAPSANYVQTNPTSYDIVYTSSMPTASSQLDVNQTLTADLSTPVLAIQPISEETSVWDHAYLAGFGISTILLAGFALSIGSDISCIRHINRKKAMNMKKK